CMPCLTIRATAPSSGPSCSTQPPPPPRPTLFPYTTLFRSPPWRAPWSRQQQALRLPSPRRRLRRSSSSARMKDRACGACAREIRSEEHTSELQSRFDLVCRLLLEKKTDQLEVVARAIGHSA